MTPRLESVAYVHSYTIHVKFADGAEADVNLETELWGEVFEPLRDAELFRKFRLDKELNTISWPTGADLAPEFLYDRATRQGGATDAPSRRR